MFTPESNQFSKLGHVKKTSYSVNLFKQFGENHKQITFQGIGRTI